MPAQPSSAYEFFPLGVALMGELADSLERAQAAVLQSDVAEMTRQSERQRKLCADLSRLQAESSQLPQGAATADQHGVLGRDLGEEWTQARLRVARLNRAYGALLRRARRTVDIFCRVLASSAITYGPPAPPLAPARQDGEG